MAQLRKLHVQVLLALVLAVVLGVLAPATAIAMKPLGDAFIALLRMLLAPIVFCTVVHGMSHVQDMRKLGRLGAKTLIYFEVVSTFAMFVGLVLVNVFKPGVGMHAAHLESTGKIAQFAASAAHMTVGDFLLGIVPATLVGAFATGNILQVLFIAILAGIALNLSVGRDSILLRGVGEAQRVLFTILGFIMRLAPLGAFGAMAAAVGSYGGATLLYLMKLVLLYWAASIGFVLLVFGGITASCGVSIFAVLRLIREELLLVFGTASGEVAFPRLVQKLQQAGCDEMVVGFVLPAGYSFNLDGTGIYMAMAVGFIAQATDTPFSISQQIALLGVLMLTSKGGTTVAGGAFIKLAATMESLRVLPLGGLGLLFGIDRLMATCTALTNMIGNTVAVIALAKWEHAFDIDAFRAWRDTHAPTSRQLDTPPTSDPRHDAHEQRAATLASPRSSTK
ncbi:cation:dicarboxylate symporter family transporter [Paraburkholderia antibiotica]|uniref:Cation:dicarboxylase symporter family transporter n=1 Tax=Paraburkholderia antibiotica TaxID=2728839 RepID=A0A7X9X3B6_9BURK|nr:cation:dicarboxylase symporter family transporter [Paraburkholderia antibiotica]NML30673.1 cation:dicarboxylase symporter family transporter [Paraburkholderia antibiotica]